jgi:hypothetical protein
MFRVQCETSQSFPSACLCSSTPYTSMSFKIGGIDKSTRTAQFDRGRRGYVVGACLSIMIADKFERKYRFAVAGLIMGIAFILRGQFIQDYAALAAAGFIGFASNSWLTACLFTYTAENFPTHIRSIASGAVERLGSALATVGPIVCVLHQPFGFS